VSSPEEFAETLRSVSSLIERAQEHLSAGREPLGAAGDRLDAAFEGSSQPAVEAAVTGMHSARGRLGEAVEALSGTADELSSYLADVLGEPRFTVAAAGGGPQSRLRPMSEHPAPGDWPGNVRAALGERFRPGVHDEGAWFSERERAVSDWLVAQNPRTCIHPRSRDPAEEEKSPDAMVRTDPGDAGTVTEYKTLKEGSSAAVKANIRSGLHQLLPHGNGHVVIDGRPVGLTETEARRGWARFVGERRRHGGSLPRRVTIILGDSRGVTWRNDV
jgi:hypothetical protein